MQQNRTHVQIKSSAGDVTHPKRTES